MTVQEIKKHFGLDSEPNYYARNGIRAEFSGNKVFLYEFKGCILTGDAKQFFSYAKVEKELKNKYYVSRDNDKKAVLQLIERIQLLFSNAELYDADRNRDALRIYPILLVSEAAMLTPGVNHLLNKWFRAKIESDSNMNSKKQRIYDLVIFDINSLILHNDQFKNDQNLVKGMIQGCCIQTKISRIEHLSANIRSEKQLESLAMSMLIPFTFYIRQKIKVATPRMFYDYATGIFPEGQGNS